MDEFNLKEFVLKFGKKKAATMLSELGRGQGFVEAVSTPVGKELLSDWVQDWRTLFGRIVNRVATDEEKLTFAIIDHKLTEAAKKIAMHYQLKMGIENAMQQ
jgi:arsenate reductase-like glutaredoxin family protein